MSILRTAGWRDWYRAQHGRRWLHETGNQFEKYFEEVMRSKFEDYINPEPAGQLGDGGCDGIRNQGKDAYACYGSRAVDGERKLAGKITSDFNRAESSWPSIQTWTFVTNAKIGPEATKSFISIQSRHGVDSDRPITVLDWDEQRFWDEVVSKLRDDHLDRIFPGVPGSANIELEDILPLLQQLVDSSTAEPLAANVGVNEVPPDKVVFNGLGLDSRYELNVGRISSPKIGSWFRRAQQYDPTIEERTSNNFRNIYVSIRECTTNPTEILERLYVSVGGDNLRMDAKRRDAVFAITAYFFDACHIFEEPPESWTAESQAGVST